MTTCNVCGHRSAADTPLCDHCKAPLHVVALGEIDDAGRRACLDALWRVLADASQAAPDGQEESGLLPDPDLWRRYLSAFWLRPETALWLYGEALAIRSFGELGGEPRLDLGCGDGIHTALYRGWQFDLTFDAFQAVDLDARDIYDDWDENRFEVRAVERGQTTTYGVDIKPSAVRRAQALGVFEQVTEADATSLPLDDHCVRTIFSNMLGQLGSGLDAALAECARVLDRAGVLMLSVLTPEFAESLYFLPASRRAAAAGHQDDAELFRRLDRGRHNFECQWSLEAWNQTLRRHEFRIAEVRSILSSHVVRFWDVGLRPFSTLLIRQVEHWRKDGVLADVKPTLVAAMDQVLQPLVQQVTFGSRPCVHVIAAVKT